VTTSEYDHLSRRVLGQFQERRAPRGENTHPSPLDGLDFCEADTHLVGTTQQGTPNRAQIAAFTGDPRYLTLYGNEECAALAKKLADTRWKL
jgi:hypothetical protein